jgi:hypothetical protein
MYTAPMAIRYMLACVILSPSKPSFQRADFENGVVSTLFKENPGFNIVICEPKNTYNFTGIEHVDWDHKHVLYQGEHKSH